MGTIVVFKPTGIFPQDSINFQQLCNDQTIEKIIIDNLDENNNPVKLNLGGPPFEGNSNIDVNNPMDFFTKVQSQWLANYQDSQIELLFDKEIEGKVGEDGVPTSIIDGGSLFMGGKKGGMLLSATKPRIKLKNIKFVNSHAYPMYLMKFNYFECDNVHVADCYPIATDSLDPNFIPLTFYFGEQFRRVGYVGGALCGPVWASNDLIINGSGWLNWTSDPLLADSTKKIAYREDIWGEINIKNNCVFDLTLPVGKTSEQYELFFYVPMFGFSWSENIKVLPEIFLGHCGIYGDIHDCKIIGGNCDRIMSFNDLQIPIEEEKENKKLRIYNNTIYTRSDSVKVFELDMMTGIKTGVEYEIPGPAKPSIISVVEKLFYPAAKTIPVKIYKNKINLRMSGVNTPIIFNLINSSKTKVDDNIILSDPSIEGANAFLMGILSNGFVQMFPYDIWNEYYPDTFFIGDNEFKRNIMYSNFYSGIVLVNGDNISGFKSYDNLLLRNDFRGQMIEPINDSHYYIENSYYNTLIVLEKNIVEPLIITDFGNDTNIVGPGSRTLRTPSDKMKKFIEDIRIFVHNKTEKQNLKNHISSL